MLIEEAMTSEELKKARCNQAYFGRLIGKSRARVNQLIKLGIVEKDACGVKLFRSLENYFRYTHDTIYKAPLWRIFR